MAEGRELDYWPWNRKVLKGLVKNLTAPGVYGPLAKSMEELGAIKGNRVTEEGKIAICNAAGFDRVI